MGIETMKIKTFVLLLILFILTACSLNPFNDMLNKNYDDDKVFMSDDINTVGIWNLKDWKKGKNDNAHIFRAGFQVYEDGSCILSEEIKMDNSETTFVRKIEGTCYLNSGQTKFKLITNDDKVQFDWTDYTNDGATMTFGNYTFSKVN